MTVVVIVVMIVVMIVVAGCGWCIRRFGRLTTIHSIIDPAPRASDGIGFLVGRRGGEKSLASDGMLKLQAISA